MKMMMLGLAGALSLVAVQANAADAKGEVATAATHAGLAAQATNLDGVHMHLHHALNCLVGPNGTGFDAKQVNPCAGRGDGAIPDTTDAAMKAKLETAVDKAKSGIAETSLAAAQKDATELATMLKADE
ncbi:MAG TPA: hypothetical protein VG867_07155 [Rhizomicrobium sp.]|nr:hypothetical protein [Rhizomicrobium sp.]